MKALRGAINLDENSVKEIEKRTVELMGELMKVNELDEKNIICIVFSLTRDITAAYPAQAFRNNFFSSVPLFSCVEPDILGGLPLTVRVLVLHEGEKSTPVYLRETKNLRKDIL